MSVKGALNSGIAEPRRCWGKKFSKTIDDSIKNDEYINNSRQASSAPGMSTTKTTSKAG
jgi:hypothetical protein